MNKTKHIIVMEEFCIFLLHKTKLRKMKERKNLYKDLCRKKK